MKIVGVCGSSASSRRTSALIQQTLAAAETYSSDVTTDIIYLSQVTLDFCDGRPVEEYSPETQQVLNKINEADAYIFGSPMYRGMMTGALKNLMDLIPNDHLKGKAAGLVATGGSDHHYLGMDLGFRTIMGFFQMYTLPGVLYQAKFSVENGTIMEEKVRNQARQFGLDLAELAKRTEGKVLGPSLY
ncbi:NADPH-dependent FMN reductase [Alteribacillus sp. JSM 102045]|uniref:NADPH-dependent FMN reductase n=1 Tax=Alteribacillus sp. JSM 102045 TaxID=1562101 RepID=UPI0035C2600C